MSAALGCSVWTLIAYVPGVRGSSGQLLCVAKLTCTNGNAGTGVPVRLYCKLYWYSVTTVGGMVIAIGIKKVHPSPPHKYIYKILISCYPNLDRLMWWCGTDGRNHTLVHTWTQESRLEDTTVYDIDRKRKRNTSTRYCTPYSTVKSVSPTPTEYRTAYTTMFPYRTVNGIR
jgi:hypothetical protein